jgi:hypothetical protein
MEDKAEEKDVLSALTAEHFAMQGAIGAATSEAQSRASIFVSALTGALVAMGFVTQSSHALIPFVATVLPALFLMGVLTVLRLTDISVDSAQAYVAIARIRNFYRALGPRAEIVFDVRFGRWPENPGNPALRLGSFVAYWTSAASMIALIDALVGAAAVTLLLKLTESANLALSLAAGLLFATAFLLAVFYYQKMRIAEVDRFARRFSGADQRRGDATLGSDQETSLLDPKFRVRVKAWK